MRCGSASSDRNLHSITPHMNDATALVGCQQLGENRITAIRLEGTMIGRKNTTAVLFTCIVAGALPAQAATHEEIVESCRQSVGRPIVQACMAGRRDMLE